MVCHHMHVRPHLVCSVSRQHSNVLFAQNGRIFMCVLQIDLTDNTEGFPDLQVCSQLEARGFSNEQVLTLALTACRCWKPFAMLVQMTVCRAL